GDGAEGKKGRAILESEAKQICKNDKSKCVKYVIKLPSHSYSYMISHISEYIPKDAMPGSKGGDSGKGGMYGYGGYGGNAILMSSSKALNGLDHSSLDFIKTYEYEIPQVGTRPLNTTGIINNLINDRRGPWMNQNVSNDFYEIIDFKLRGKSGDAGKAGIGGEYGDITIPSSKGLVTKSDKRGPSGMVKLDLNKEGIQKRNKSIIEFYERETDYLKF
ncbi:unnamed protein product, partial [Brachionus calyciflorus]